METAVEAIQRFHDRYPGAASQVFGDTRTEDGRSSYDLVAGALPSTARRILELGCGDGLLLSMLPDRERTGLDLNQAELDVARGRLGDSVRLVRGSAQALPFEDAGFDAVISHMALMIMEDLPTVITEMARVLAPGGVMAHVVGRPRTEMAPVVQGYFDALREHLREAGLAFEWPDTSLLEDPPRALPGFDVQTEDLTLHTPVPTASLGAYLRQSYYAHGLLPDDHQRALEAHVQALATRDTVLWPLSVRLIRAQRS